MRKTKTSRTTRRLSHAGGESQVMADNLELPRGSFFTTLAGVPVETGDLIMFAVGRRASIGIWLPSVGGYNWILQPGVLIACAGAPVRIAGKVIPIPPLKACPTGRIKATPGSRS